MAGLVAVLVTSLSSVSSSGYRDQEAHSFREVRQLLSPGHSGCVQIHAILFTAFISTKIKPPPLPRIPEYLSLSQCWCWCWWETKPQNNTETVLNC